MKRIQINQLNEQIGKEVTIAGWVDIRRDHGKLIFIDLRDTTGIIQMVVLPNHKEAHADGSAVRNEWVLQVTGVVNERPERMVNPDLETGKIELEVTGIEVLNESKTPPFEINENTADVDEATRLKYRYLDLRTKRMHENMKLRSEFLRHARNFLNEQNFTEIETPLLTESTAEGSRDFVVPSRLHPGKFYALPQSPQQYKQMLMTAGFERYFQIARAIRDEDLRADRGFEHTQVDIEMSFVNMEEVMGTIETMIITTVESMGFTIKEKPFPRISYKDAMEEYGDDKFDLRTESEKKEGILAYAWVIEFPFFERTDEGGWTFSHNPFSMPIPEHVDWLLEGKNLDKILTTQYDLVCNGYESGGGSIRAHKPEILKATYKAMGYTEEETRAKVGHMIEAFELGTPPHGGIALGVERNLMNLTGEESLREVQAFPMTRTGQTSVMKGPTDLSLEQLLELHLKITKNTK